MSIRTRLAASAVALLLVATACTRGPAAVSPSPSPSPTGSSPTSPPSPASVSPAPVGPGSAAAALAKLCTYPQPSPASAPAEGTTPPAIARVETQVEQVRGLDFTQPVVVDPATHEELVKGLQKSFDASYPAKLFERKSVAWQTIGAIPAGASIRQAIEEFASGQVIGYYDTQSKDLVFIGADNPSPVDRVTLAHELTHAVDDQHFGLQRLDHLASTCQDEAFDAALALTEGDATWTMVAYAQRFLSMEEQLQLGLQQGPATASIPPFVVQFETWPYTAGLAFVRALVARGGEQAVNDAFKNLPVSTEQILHPDRYPNDLPVPVDVANLAPRLGPGWTDLDVQGIGEEWLSLVLGLRIDQTAAASAAAGWGGGIYRAWSDGDRVAVVMSTVWDTPQDANEFASAMRSWIAAGSGRRAKVEPVDGSHVKVLFASDPQTLSALEVAVSP